MATNNITKEDAELLCRIAWRDAKMARIGVQEVDIDSWLMLIFDGEFNKCKKHSSNLITKKLAQKLCQICWWDARVNSAIYSSKIRLWIKSEFPKILKKYDKSTT